MRPNETAMDQWYRVTVDSWFVGWVSKLPHGQRLCWYGLLAIVKGHGDCGSIPEDKAREWSEKAGLDAADFEAVLAAAASVTAVTRNAGVLEVVKWREFQTDTHAAKRMRALREREKSDKPSPVPSQEETDTDTDTERLRNVTPVTRNSRNGDETGNVCDGGIEKPRGDAPQVAAVCCQHVRRIHDTAFPPADRTRTIWPQSWNAKVTDAVVSGRIGEDAILSLTPDDMKAARKLCRDSASWGWGWVEKYMAARSTAPRAQSIQERIAADAAFREREAAARAKLLAKGTE